MIKIDFKKVEMIKIQDKIRDLNLNIYFMKNKNDYQSINLKNEYQNLINEYENILNIYQKNLI